jgi:hypothetical protein
MGRLRQTGSEASIWSTAIDGGNYEKRRGQRERERDAAAAYHPPPEQQTPPPGEAAPSTAPAMRASPSEDLAPSPSPCVLPPGSHSSAPPPSTLEAAELGWGREWELESGSVRLGAWEDEWGGGRRQEGTMLGTAEPGRASSSGLEAALRPPTPCFLWGHTLTAIPFSFGTLLATLPSTLLLTGPLSLSLRENCGNSGQYCRREGL